MKVRFYYNGSGAQDTLVVTDMEGKLINIVDDVRMSEIAIHAKQYRVGAQDIWLDQDAMDNLCMSFEGGM